MTIRSAFLQGFSAGFRHWRTAAIVYFFQLCLALTLGMQIHTVLESSIGNSLEINKLLHNYDHTVIADFLKVHGASITPLIGQLRWLLLVYLIFSVFLDAGMLYCAVLPERAAWQDFWKGAATHFFPFLKIAVFFLLLALVWTAVLWVPLALFFQPSLEVFPSEKYTLALAFVVLVVYLLGLAVLFLWSVAARLHKMKSGDSIKNCLQQGWRVFSKNKKGYLGLLSLFVLLQALLVAVYFLLESFGGMVSAFLILVFFVVQQAFVFFRIQIKVMMYAGVGAKGALSEIPPQDRVKI